MIAEVLMVVNKQRQQNGLQKSGTS